MPSRGGDTVVRVSSDFSWIGEGIPNWIAAVGGLATAGIAVAGLIKAGKATKGVEQLAEVVEKQQLGGAGVASSASKPERAKATPGEASQPALVRWTVHKVGRNLYWLINGGDVLAHLVAYGPTSEGFIFRPQTPVPTDIAPGQSAGFHWMKAWQTPSAMSLRVAWTEGDAVEREAYLPVT